MAQRGRKSAAALALVALASNVEAIPRQKAPAELTKEQAVVWNAVAASQPADWFSDSTRPMLAQYWPRPDRCVESLHGRPGIGPVQ
jgi:hypothetical protein